MRNLMQHSVVEGNQITSIPDDFFSPNHELERIWIGYTQITKLPENLLKNLKSLRNVTFQNNEISLIPENFFSDNEKLERINLLNNKISKLPRTLLKGLNSESLEQIDLRYNPINSIPDNYFTENDNLRYKILSIFSFLTHDERV